MCSVRFRIKDTDKETGGVKDIIISVLEKFEILKAMKKEECNLYNVKILNERGFRGILELFYCLYVLEKLYSRKYGISVASIKDENIKKELKRHLRSSVPKDRQAYLLNVGGNVILVTYFGCHGKHINLFSRTSMLVRDFKKAIFKSFARPKYVSSVSDCPIVLAFKYHLSEASNIIYKLKCKPSIDFSKFCCEQYDGICKCLDDIETVILKDISNRECNLRIFGGHQIFFDVDYNIVNNLISLEESGCYKFVKNRGYECIFNFLLGCYFSSILNAEFNSNINLEFDGLEKEVDIILASRDSISIIETTREHGVCCENKYFEKLEKSILRAILVHSVESDRRLRYILLTLTPEVKFNGDTYYLTFVTDLFNFKHVGVPGSEGDEIVRFVEEAKYFSPVNTIKILRYQLKKLEEFLKDD